jgi:GAF domain-containing protein
MTTRVAAVIIGLIMSGSELLHEASRGPEWLAKEQAALRRVATLVANGTPPDAVLRATVDEVRQILSVDLSSIARYELPDRVVVLHRSGEGIADEPFDLPLGGENVATLVAGTGQAARMDDYSGATGPLAEWARSEGVRGWL